MDAGKLPKHVAIIMDGNGRWAQRQFLPRTQGHVEGVLRVEEAVKHASDSGIQVLTIYAFSTENWSRPPDEVTMLMRLFISALTQKAKELHAKGVRIKFIGRRQDVGADVLKAVDNAEAMTAQNTKMTLNVAFNYGSRMEIIDAVRALSRKVKDGHLAPEAITEEMLSDELYTRGQPDVDLLIRTSGEQRISNFLLWQLSYAEIYFTPKFWPEFTAHEFAAALNWFASRDRRYGGVKPV